VRLQPLDQRRKMSVPAANVLLPASSSSVPNGKAAVGVAGGGARGGAVLRYANSTDDILVLPKKMEYCKELITNCKFCLYELLFILFIETTHKAFILCF
jgi:hypothetical protein